MTTYTTYDVVGKKEDVSDIISNISPTKTPFQTTIGSEKVTNILFQWQEDVLASPNTGNAQVDGFDATDATLVPTSLRNNYTQILAKSIKVSETVDTVSKYGRAKETAYQLQKGAAELKRDLEAILLSGQDAAAGQSALNNVPTSIGFTNTGSGSAAVARTMGSFQAQIDTTGAISPSTIIHTGSSSTAMTETVLLGVLEQLYINGVDPSMLMIPPAEALTLAAYASASGRTRFLDNDGESSRKIVNVVDVYVSPFGELKVVLNRFQLATDYLIFDPALWKLAVMRPWTRETLAKVGDATRMMIVGEYSLKHKNWRASAVVRKAT